MTFFEVHGGDFKVGGAHQVSSSELIMEMSEKKGIGRKAHITHAIVSVATGGAWLIVWAIHCWFFGSPTREDPAHRRC